MKGDLISIIVPIYNVAPYLRMCVDSILTQTYQNIEIVLVDDGSTDESGEICDEYESRDNRIVVVHKENGGLTSCRRAGVNRASGKYVGFVDGDDWIEPNMYEFLYKSIIEHEADISTGRSYRNYEHEINSYESLGDGITPGIYDIWTDDLFVLKSVIPVNSVYINGSLCFKLFKTKAVKCSLNNMSDNVNGVMDDTACLLDVILQSSKLCVTNRMIYHHREHKDSFTYKENRSALAQLNYAFLEMERILKERGVYERIYSHFREYIWRNLDKTILEVLGGDYCPEPKFLIRTKKVPLNSRVVLYGYGDVGKSYELQLKCNGLYKIVAIVDKSGKEGTIKKEKLSEIECDYIIIAIYDEEVANAIKKDLVDIGIRKDKLIWEKPMDKLEFYKL